MGRGVVFGKGGKELGRPCWAMRSGSDVRRREESAVNALSWKEDGRLERGSSGGRVRKPCELGEEDVEDEVADDSDSGDEFTGKPS